MKTLYPKLSKWSFILYLCFIAVTIILYKILSVRDFAQPFNESKCYWINDMFPYVKCGKDIALYKVLEFLSNLSFKIVLWPFLLFLMGFLAIPILLIPLTSFYFLVISYPILKFYKFSFGEINNKNQKIIYKWIKILFIALIVISFVLQAYNLNKRYLENKVYWNAKLGIVSSNDSSADVDKALQYATYRGEIDIVKSLFSKSSNSEKLLYTAADKAHYELVDFFLVNNVPVPSNSLKDNFYYMISNNLCENKEKPHLKVLKRLLKDAKSIDDDLIRKAALSLCPEFLEAFLESKLNESYILREGDSLIELVSAVRVSPEKPNKWLKDYPVEKDDENRRKIIELIKKYQQEAKTI